MPFYDYQCSQCGHAFEEFQSMSDALLVDCPQCKKSSLKRLIGGAGVIFKGSGFYVNDSKPSPSKEKATPSKKESA